jgi:hypothetical protein
MNAKPEGGGGAGLGKALQVHDGLPGHVIPFFPMCLHGRGLL